MPVQALTNGILMDTLTPHQRSERMGRVRGKDSKPEMKVRQLVHSMGFRYRLHGKGLPGRPDLVFRSRSKVIFVHGCFWHRHANCALARIPKSRHDFWVPKLERNAARDRTNLEKLTSQGWDSLVIWECELRDLSAVAKRVRVFLSGEANKC